MSQKLRTTLVIGGGMAGLLLAGVLSNHCENIIILERDHFVDASVLRSGVPQASHSHALLTRGQELFEEFFPGILSEILTTGARVIDHVNDRRRLVSYGWQPRFPSDLRMLLVSRATLELHVRRRVLAIPNVSLEQGVHVDDLLADGRKIVGVRLEDTGDQVRELFGDLIADASGRSSNAPQWLEDLGFGTVEEQIVDAKWAYASRFFKHPDTWPHDWLNTIMWPQLRRSDPQKTRGGILSPLDGNRCMVTLVGNSGDFPPRDEAGFLAFARSLISPVIADFITSSVPLSPITFSRSTGNRWRRYDRLETSPENFVVVGDAVAAFNPVYAQGMSCAAIEAKELGLALGAWLSRTGPDLAGFARQVQDKIVAAGNFAWTMSTQADSVIEGVVGIEPPSKAALAYYERAMALGAVDPKFVVNCERMANLVGDNKWMADPDVERLVIENWDRLGDAAGAPSWPAPPIGLHAMTQASENGAG